MLAPRLFMTWRIRGTIVPPVILECAGESSFLQDYFLARGLMGERSFSKFGCRR